MGRFFSVVIVGPLAMVGDRRCVLTIKLLGELEPELEGVLVHVAGVRQEGVVGLVHFFGHGGGPGRVAVNVVVHEDNGRGWVEITDGPGGKVDASYPRRERSARREWQGKVYESGAELRAPRGDGRGQI